MAGWVNSTDVPNEEDSVVSNLTPSNSTSSLTVNRSSGMVTWMECRQVFITYMDVSLILITFHFASPHSFLLLFQW